MKRVLREVICNCMLGYGLTDDFCDILNLTVSVNKKREKRENK